MGKASTKAASAGKFITRDSGKRRKLPSGSQRDDRSGKGRFDLIPPIVIRRLAQLYERGAVKYEARNWERGQPLSWYLDSGFRHLIDYMQGDRSEDHLTAVIWNMAGYEWTLDRIAAGVLPRALDDIEAILARHGAARRARGRK